MTNGRDLSGSSEFMGLCLAAGESQSTDSCVKQTLNFQLHCFYPMAKGKLGKYCSYRWVTAFGSDGDRLKVFKNKCWRYPFICLYHSSIASQLQPISPTRIHWPISSCATWFCLKPASPCHDPSSHRLILAISTLYLSQYRVSAQNVNSAFALTRWCLDHWDPPAMSFAQGFCICSLLCGQHSFKSWLDKEITQFKSLYARSFFKKKSNTTIRHSGQVPYCQL